MHSQIVRVTPARFTGRLSRSAAEPRRIPRTRSIRARRQTRRQSAVSGRALEEEELFETSPHEEEPEVEDGEEIELTEEERQLIAMEDSESEEMSLKMDSLSEEEDSWEYTMSGDQDLDPSYADREPFIDKEALEQTHEFGKAMAAVADEIKCQSIRLLDVHKKLDWADAFLIVTAMSRTQLRAVLGKMEKVALEEWGKEVLEAVTRRSEWECIDFGDLVVHVFSPRTRTYYNLDEKYQKCQEIEIPFIGSPVSAPPQWQRTLRSDSVV